MWGGGDMKIPFTRVQIFCFTLPAPRYTPQIKHATCPSILLNAKFMLSIISIT